MSIRRYRWGLASRTREDLCWAFADHDLIERLGCGSVINVLAIYDDEVIGSANLLHEEHHYSDADIEDALPFVQLLVPAGPRRRAWPRIA